MTTEEIIERNKKKLKAIICTYIKLDQEKKTLKNENPNMIFDDKNYDLYNLITEGMYQEQQANYNKDDFQTLTLKALYFFHLKYGIENLNTLNSNKYDLSIDINPIIRRPISFEDFLVEFRKISTFPISPNLVAKHREFFKNNEHIKDYDQVMYFIAKRKLLNDTNGEWLKIYAPNSENIEEMGKIYLSIEDKDQFKFAELLLEKCHEKGIEQYQFKVARNSPRIDSSIVIYFTKENFQNYIKIIEEIKSENPQIKFNEPSFLAHPYNEYISVAKDVPINTKMGQSMTSFTDFFVHYIQNEVERGKLTIDQIVERIFRYNSKKLLTEIIDLCNKTRNNLSIQHSTPAIITNQQKRIDYLCLTGMAIFDDEDKRNMWIAVVNKEITEQNYGYYLDEVLNIISMIKNEIPAPMIKNILNQTSNPQLISQYLQQFIAPQILEQLTSNPPKR